MGLVETLTLTLGILCPEDIEYKLFNNYADAYAYFKKECEEGNEELSHYEQTQEDKCDGDTKDRNHQSMCVSCNDIEGGYQVRLEKVEVNNE